MYRFYINNIDSEYHYMELARVFLPDDGFEIIPYEGSSVKNLLSEDSYLLNEAEWNLLQKCKLGAILKSLLLYHIGI